MLSHQRGSRSLHYGIFTPKCLVIKYIKLQFWYLIMCTFSAFWVHFAGDRKREEISVLSDNDVTTCLTQDPKAALLAKINLTDFPSLIVTIVSNQDYPDRRQMCVQPSEQPWLLMTHLNSERGSTCNVFCGPLGFCVYGGIINQTDTLFWHRMHCDCGTQGCNELALHIVPHHHATLAICDILYL